MGDSGKPSAQVPGTDGAPAQAGAAEPGPPAPGAGWAGAAAPEPPPVLGPQDLEGLDRLGRLASSVVHELGNQVTGILGPAQVLADNLSGLDHELAAQVVRSSEAVQDLLRRLSILGRLRRDRPRGLSSDACAAVLDTTQALKWLLPPEVAVVTALPAGRQVVRLSPAELTQLVSMLVLEAAADAAPGGKISVAVEPQGEATVTLRVEGPGAEPLLGSAARARLSARLGLAPDAIVASPGAVSLALPRGGSAAPREGALGAALVVDPEPGVQLVLGAALKRLGFEVFAVEDAATAGQLAEARGEPFALAMVELRLPDGDGLVLAAGLPAARRVVMSADPNAPGLQDALRAAGLPLLGKPFQLDEVAALVR